MDPIPFPKKSIKNNQEALNPNPNLIDAPVLHFARFGNSSERMQLAYDAKHHLVRMICMDAWATKNYVLNEEE